MKKSRKNLFPYLPNPLFTKKKGFTLAEVLIVIAIIGVVAAITIPTLMSKHQERVFKTKLKKDFAQLNQILKLNLANYDYDLSAKGENYGWHNIIPNNSTELHKLTQEEVDKYYTVAAINDNDDIFTDDTFGYYGTYAYYIYSDFHSEGTFYAFPDGSYFVYKTNYDNDCTLSGVVDVKSYLKTAPSGDNNNADCVGFIDVNGISGPNVQFKDVFPLYYFDSQVILLEE